MKQLIYNAIKTPDGTIIESRYRHDYRTHKDANGKLYMIDGGLDYTRASANGDEEYLAIYDDVDHKTKRDIITWGTYGKNGDQPLKNIQISKMSDAHITAVLETQPHIYPTIKKAMIDEQKYRESNPEFKVND